MKRTDVNQRKITKTVACFAGEWEWHVGGIVPPDGFLALALVITEAGKPSVERAYILGLDEMKELADNLMAMHSAVKVAVGKGYEVVE